MTESNAQNKHSSITKRNLKFSIYFLKNIAHYFIDTLCGLDHHISALLHHSLWARGKEGLEAELFRGMMIPGGRWTKEWVWHRRQPSLHC